MRAFWIACACVSTCLIPVIAGWVWRRKYQKMRPVWMGVLGFFAFAGIAEMLFVMLCLSALGPVSRELPEKVKKELDEYLFRKRKEQG